MYVSYSESRRGGECLNPKERWSDRAPTYIEVTVNGLYLERPESLYLDEVPVKGELHQPKAGDRAYLLVVRHSDGDTFGTSYGHAHFEGVYETLEEAEAVAKTIDDDTYESPSKWGYTPWKGYFCHLEGVEIHAMTVNQSASSTPYKLVNH